MRLKAFIACIIMGFSAFAQLNPEYLMVYGQKGILNNDITLISQDNFVNPRVVQSPSSGADSLKLVQIGNSDVWMLNFQPPADFTGDTYIGIEYRENGSLPGLTFPRYMTVHYRVKTTKIVTSPDVVAGGTAPVSIQPLMNDQSSDGPLTISRIGYISGGGATINNGTSMSFVFAPGEREAYIVYFAMDSTGHEESGLVHALNADFPVQPSIQLFGHNSADVPFAVSDAGATVTIPAGNGNLTQDGLLWTYVPNEGFSGTDQWTLSYPTGEQTDYQITIFDNPGNISFVKDDVVHVISNTTISFDVFENDMLSDFPITDHSPELIHLGEGVFEFTPATGFNGDLSLYYKVFTGLQFHTGNILVRVGDYAPENTVEYKFDIPVNEVLKLEYNPPVSDYTFSLATSPSFGNVSILDAAGTYTTQCEILTGEHTIVYSPDADYTGSDAFDIEYCTTSGVCEILKIDVSVIAHNNPACFCYTNCVYNGDINDDGIVNLRDLLSFGLNFGQAGVVRSDNGMPNAWIGMESIDWGYEQLSTKTDLKCGDANGDGYIDHDDFFDISNNFGRSHRLVSPHATELSDIPLTFTPQESEVDSGEWMVLDVALGNVIHPALDVQGIAFNFNINPDLIDSSSVQFELTESSWFGQNSPVTTYLTQPTAGDIQVAVSRLSQLPANGVDVIGTLKFIVEDEIGGFKRERAGKTPLDIFITQPILQTIRGKALSLPEYKDRVYVTSDQDSESWDAALKIYPNPARGIVNIQTQAGSIEKIEVFDISGRRILLKDDIRSTTYTLDVSQFMPAMYLVRLYSGESFATRKITIVND